MAAPSPGMKVVHALPTYLPISENWIYPQIVGVSGIEPAVLCDGVSNTELFPLHSAPVFLDPPPWKRAAGLPRLINSIGFRLGREQLIASREIARWQPRLVHAHFGSTGWSTRSLARRVGAPLITSFYGMDAWLLPEQNAFWRTRFVELFRDGDLFLVEGPAMRERLVVLGCPRAKIRIARLGVAVDELSFRERTFAAPLHVIMVARFVAKKGMPDGLRACVAARQAGVDLRVTIIGAASDPAGEIIGNELRQIAGSRELAGRVEFTGFQTPTRTRELMDGADVFLCPSQHSPDGDAEGGSPLSLTQAMAMGLLCIGTRHCDIPEVIRDRETGLLCESRDVPALADLITSAAGEPQAVQAMCRNGRAHIEARFSSAAMTAGLAELYAEVTSEAEVRTAPA